jgi:hypothetical protein
MTLDVPLDCAVLVLGVRLEQLVDVADVRSEGASRRSVARIGLRLKGS